MEFSFYSLIALLDRVDGDETVRSVPRQTSQVMKESMSFQFFAFRKVGFFTGRRFGFFAALVT